MNGRFFVAQTNYEKSNRIVINPGSWFELFADLYLPLTKKKPINIWFPFITRVIYHRTLIRRELQLDTSAEIATAKYPNTDTARLALRTLFQSNKFNVSTCSSGEKSDKYGRASANNFLKL